MPYPIPHRPTSPTAFAPGSGRFQYRVRVVGLQFAQSTIDIDPSIERVLDLIGIFVFAVSGGLVAVRKHFDVVGVIALASVTALGGGLIRDALLGDTPPPALTQTSYLLVPLAAAAITFAAHTHIEKRWLRAHLVFDAAGLGLFCVSGTSKALSFGLTGIGAIALGVLTATGGGVIRDVLAQEAPVLFRSDTILYGVPAALGATAVTLAWRFDAFSGTVAVAIAFCVFALRITALRFGWHAPRPRLRT